MTELSNVKPESRGETVLAAPDKMVKIRELFGIDSDMEIPAFSEADERVPDLDPAYVFDPDTTLAICAGFARNRRVMIQGPDGPLYVYFRPGQHRASHDLFDRLVQRGRAVRRDEHGREVPVGQPVAGVGPFTDRCQGLDPFRQLGRVRSKVGTHQHPRRAAHLLLC